jgi:hypothetical protein
MVALVAAVTSTTVAGFVISAPRVLAATQLPRFAFRMPVVTVTHPTAPPSRVADSAPIVSSPARIAPAVPAHRTREAHRTTDIPVFAPPHVAAPAQPATGSLRVIVLPWGDVEIDGRSFGRAPVAATLTTGIHRIRIWGGVMRNEQVEIHADQVTVLHIEEP